MEKELNEVIGERQNNVCIDSNEEAWNKETYNAWIQRLGEPYEAIKKIKKIQQKLFRYCITSLGM